MRLFHLALAAVLAVAVTPGLCASNTSTNADAGPEFIEEVVQVKYARAADLAAALNSLGTNPPSRFGASPEAREIVSNAWGRLSDSFKQTNSRRGYFRQTISSGHDGIIADERTNSLLIAGRVEDVRILKEVIDTLDRCLTQVLIEAVVFEVALPDSPGASGPAWLHDWMKARNGFSAEPNESGSDADGVGRAISFRPVNETNGAAFTSKCFSQVADLEEEMEKVLRDLAGDDRVKILQRPRVQTSVSEPATFFVGEIRPYPTGSMASYTCASSIQQLQPGANLEVTIRLNEDNSLRAEIHQISEQTNGVVEIVKVDAVPTTSRHESQVELTIANRATVLVGGLNEPGAKRGTRRHILVLLRPTLLSQEGTVAAAAGLKQLQKP